MNRAMEGGPMFKIKDLLLILVAGYAVYQIGWGSGWTTVNMIILVCSIISLAFTCLERAGVIKKYDKKRQEAEKRNEQK